MADITRDAPLRFRYPSLLRSEKFFLDNSAAHQVYRGQPAIIDASADTLNPQGWVSTITISTGNDKFVGIYNEGGAVLTTDQELGLSNEFEILTRGEVGMKAGALTDADIGKTITMSDSGTLGTTAADSTHLPIGKLNRVIDGFAYIELTGPVVL